MAGILTFCLGVFYSLSDAGSVILDYLGNTVPGLENYTVMDILFGGGLVIYVGWAIVKFLLPT